MPFLIFGVEMEKLWAPWRMEYIQQPKKEGCIFCDKPLQAGKEREKRI